MVVNFWKYQNADVWKKSKTHPPWFKHFVHHDRELDKLPVVARLLFVEILKSATRHSNVLENDLNWLCGETRIAPDEIAEALPLLLKGGWLSETKSTRRSRHPSRENREDSREQEVEVEVDVEGDQEPEKSASSNGSSEVHYDAGLPLDITKEIHVARMMAFIGTDADEGTRGVIVSIARKLPEGPLAKVVESLGAAKVNGSRAGYCVGALKSELETEGAAA